MTIDQEPITRTDTGPDTGTDTGIDARIDMAAVGAFAQQYAGLVTGAATIAMVALGDELGLYAVLGRTGPVTAEQLAVESGMHERYLREWLAQQAAAGVLVHHPATGTFELPAAHAAVLADDESPVAMASVAQQMIGMFAAVGALAEGFRTGAGIAWGEHDPTIYSAAERFWGGQYRNHLLKTWVPAVPELEDRLRSGARAAEVGCGRGAATVLLAGAFPASRFVGYDLHEPSIEVARQRAAEAGVADRVRFEVHACQSYPEKGYDLISFFDAFHDLGDPVGAARHARAALAPGGSLLVVEPVATDDLASNLATNPAAGLGYAASTVLCVPNSLSQPVGLALGGQAGAARITEVLTEAGFPHVEVVARSDFNLVLHADVRSSAR